MSSSGRLQQEIKQGKPFVSPREEAFLALQRTANLQFRGLSSFLKPWGLTATQYNALRILRGAMPDGLPCREVGARMVTPVPDITRLVDRLAAKDLVARRRGARDRRVVTVRITERGVALLTELDRPLELWVEQAMEPVDGDELAALIGLLDRLRCGAA